MKKFLALVALVLPFFLFAQTKYKQPPKEVVDILDATPTPFVVVSPQRDAILFVDYKPHPSIDFISRAFVRLAGLRINPELGTRQRLTQYTGITIRRLSNINEPILLIHGEADNNSGTYPIQSQRLFEAIKGNGGTARLLFLALESHGYAARESNLHLLAEMIEWADKYVKNKVQIGAK